MIKLRNIIKKFDDNIVLNDINIDIKDKGFIAITGHSGCGKSTLLNILGGIDTATSGIIIVDDKQLSNLEYEIYRNNNIAFIFQDYLLEPNFSVSENISIPLYAQGKKKNEIVEDINKVCNQLKLTKLINTKTKKLSGGEKQRVAIARALVSNPKVILADEPTGNLDSKNSENVIKILKDISKDCVVIMVTHNLEEAKQCDIQVEMCDGKIK